MDGNHWWMKFGQSDGGPFFGSRQCKFKPSQKDLFKDVREQRRHAFSAARDTRHMPLQPCPSFLLFAQVVTNRLSFYKVKGVDTVDAPGIWNEANIYIGRDDGDATGALWRNFIGIVVVPNRGDDDAMRRA
eukprot:1993552-Prymnesium_polylepis.1